MLIDAKRLFNVLNFEYEDKWVILLALTSNKGALDFQFTTDMKGEKLFKRVIRKSAEWGDSSKLMYVVGATRNESIGQVRALTPDHFFLVPGVGAQGGSMKDVADYGWNDNCGLLVNSSRGIIYAGNGKDFGDRARLAAQDLQEQMSAILTEKGFV